MNCGRPARHGKRCTLDKSHVARGERHFNGDFAWALRGSEDPLKLGSLWRAKSQPHTRLVVVLALDSILPLVHYRHILPLGRALAADRTRFLSKWRPAVCWQCGNRYSSRACGPTHALVEHARRSAS